MKSVETNSIIKAYTLLGLIKKYYFRNFIKDIIKL
jgi:hypothetical protein